jgi:hypothetical protein
MGAYVADVISWVAGVLTAGLGRLSVPFTEGTVMNTFMVRQAVVTVSVQTTASHTNQVAGTTLRPTEFDAGPQIYDSIAECSA